MKGADRAILLVLPLLALGIGFYMLVISPKQAEISDLDERVTELRSTVDIAEAQVLAAEAARGETATTTPTSSLSAPQFPRAATSPRSSTT